MLLPCRWRRSTRSVGSRSPLTVNPNCRFRSTFRFLSNLEICTPFANKNKNRHGFARCRGLLRPPPRPLNLFLLRSSVCRLNSWVCFCRMCATLMHQQHWRNQRPGMWVTLMHQWYWRNQGPNAVWRFVSPSLSLSLSPSPCLSLPLSVSFDVFHYIVPWHCHYGCGFLRVQDDPRYLAACNQEQLLLAKTVMEEMPKVYLMVVVVVTSLNKEAWID